MTKANPNEGDVKDAIKKLLTKHGWFHFMPPANMYGVSGISDILALKDGTFLAIEAKLTKTEGRPNQEIFMKAVRDHGGFAMLISMKRLPVLAEWLVMFDRVANAAREAA